MEWAESRPQDRTPRWTFAAAKVLQSAHYLW